MLIKEISESINPLSFVCSLSAWQRAGDVIVSSSTRPVVRHRGTFRMGKQDCHGSETCFEELASLSPGASRDRRRAHHRTSCPHSLWCVAV